MSANPPDGGFGEARRGGHPDVEALSAYLDGELDSIEGHEACDECGRRLDELGRAAAWVASVPRELPDLDAAISRALAQRNVVDLRPSFARPRVLAGLAVAALVAALLTPVVLLTRGGEDDQVASDRESESAALADATVTNGGDLGDQRDPLVLAAAVRQAMVLAGAPSVAAAPAAGGSAGSGDSDQAGDARTGPPSSGPDASQRSMAMAARGPAPTHCVTEAAAASGGGVLVYAATLRWEKTPAVALGFHLASSKLAYRLVVMSRSGCRLLVVQSF